MEMFILFGTFYLLLYGMANSEGILYILMRLSPQELTVGFCLGGPWNVTPVYCPRHQSIPGKQGRNWHWPHFLSLTTKHGQESFQLICLVHGSPHQNSEFKINNLIHLSLLSPFPIEFFLLNDKDKTKKYLKEVFETCCLSSKNQRNTIVFFWMCMSTLHLALIINCSVCQETGLRRTAWVSV